MYLVSVGLTYDDSAGAINTMGFRIKKNGAIFFEVFNPSTIEELTLGITQIINLSDGDTIGVYAFQLSGASKDILGGRANNFMTIKRLSKL
jgi:hypothetical protein